MVNQFSFDIKENELISYKDTRVCVLMRTINYETKTENLIKI